MDYIPLEDLEVYKVAMEIGDSVWETVDGWRAFERYSTGKQFVEAADSIAANIAEGYGRYHFNDSRNFYFFARGSLLETKTWLRKSQKRNLIALTTSEQLLDKLGRCHFLLNQFIKSQKNRK
jgi:four helix bundle protein